MKIKISNIEIDETSEIITYSIQILDKNGKVMQELSDLSMNTEEYSKRRVISIMRKVGLQHHSKKKRPIGLNREKIIKELKTLELELDESKILDGELFAIDRESDFLPKPHSRDEEPNENAV